MILRTITGAASDGDAWDAPAPFVWIDDVKHPTLDGESALQAVNRLATTTPLTGVRRCVAALRPKPWTNE